MANYWNTAGVPHKGWVYETIIDLKEDGEDYETCMMCGREEIRYVHILSHEEIDETFRVGCVCAEKMTGDYVNPKERQRQLENKAKRKENWKYKDWKQNLKGNHYYKFEGHMLVIFRDSKTNKFKCIIDGKFGSKLYQYLSEAKEAIFNKIEEMKEKGSW
jgi:hypothetical protein